MKKLIFAMLVIVGSMVVFTSCTDENVLPDLETTETGEGGGSGGSDPIIED